MFDMTRIEKKKKLANAIKDWRGSWDNVTGKWVRPPQHKESARVILCLQRLNLDVVAELNRIEKFATHDEFHAWLATI